MSQKFYIPTYEECVAIVKANENFLEKKSEVNGVMTSVFNYRLATHKDFLAPLGEDSPVQAHELRGITFVHEESGTKRYLMLHKFFNIDQVEGYLYSQLQGKKVVRVADKADGSMIRFVPIKGQLVAKTKVAFESDQARLAQALLDKSPKQKAFVQATLDRGLSAIYELVSPLNQIVLKYSESKLVLLQLREEATGKYLDIYSHDLVKEFDIECVTQEPIESLEDYMAKQATVTDREGWILTFEDGQMAKRKTQWYMDRHGIVTEGLARENHILAMILAETIDDAMAMINEQDARRAYAEAIQKSLAVYLEHSLKECVALFGKYQGSRKDFAVSYRQDPWFHVVVGFVDKGLDEEKLYKVLKEKVGEDTKHLLKAREFVGKTLKVQLLDLFVEDEDN